MICASLVNIRTVKHIDTHMHIILMGLYEKLSQLKTADNKLILVGIRYGASLEWLDFGDI